MCFVQRDVSHSGKLEFSYVCLTVLLQKTETLVSFVFCSSTTWLSTGEDSVLLSWVGMNISLVRACSLNSQSLQGKGTLVRIAALVLLLYVGKTYIHLIN